ncbi:hypothetical protein DESAMIL20_1676 [Desulfurella amilsii]|uniref:TsaA-like domain-containing protein n=1 Tax=Desulfurella amilsii TaxID=1562698 RepID=A0A1X4XX63_9BACT|nr:tRNA (N6-threonylcarbamoyladenosine(37)-N6)-methyltransferase TrmO [Desulfurella amilsii]OSS42123.1 hypothetical protein DESAMIL20_1676 [Desulfurella amilsii]
MFEDLVIKIEPIGWVESNFEIGQKQKTTGIIHIFDEYKQGLFRLNEFKSIMVLFYFHKFNDFSLIATPPHNNPNKAQYGVFATHSPKRPNHIGVSNVAILEVGEDFIKIDNCDMIPGTPILDIKAQWI